MHSNKIDTIWGIPVLVLKTMSVTSKVSKYQKHNKNYLKEKMGLFLAHARLKLVIQKVYQG